jgi:hypothetical protein
MPSFQPTLPMRIAHRIPLMTVDAAKGRLELDEDAVMALVELGSIEWAFNIARDGAKRREVRLLNVSVEHAQAVLTGGQPIAQPVDLDGVMALMFGPYKAWLTSRAIRIAWNCGADHVIQLIEEGTLKRFPKSSYRAGRGGAAVVAWETVKEFLEDRRIV